MQSILINHNSFYILYVMNYFLLYCLNIIFVTHYIFYLAQAIVLYFCLTQLVLITWKIARCKLPFNKSLLFDKYVAAYDSLLK